MVISSYNSVLEVSPQTPLTGILKTLTHTVSLAQKAIFFNLKFKICQLLAIVLVDEELN